MATEGIEKYCDQVRGCCVLAHLDDLWPICVAVNEDQELLSSICAEIDGNFLEGTCWPRFCDERFTWLGWKCLLTLLALEDNVVDVIIDSRPIDNLLRTLPCAN